MPTPIQSLSNLLQLLQLSHVKKRIAILKSLAWQLHQEHQQREAVIFADTAHFILVAAVLPKIQPAATVTKSVIGKRFAGVIHIKLQLQLGTPVAASYTAEAPTESRFCAYVPNCLIKSSVEIDI